MKKAESDEQPEKAALFCVRGLKHIAKSNSAHNKGGRGDSRIARSIFRVRGCDIFGLS